ncbi:hypothetical protein NDR87_07470 [Nocardia sp. CDC159]|uniref:Uncharacterized protein n=1 Tax=Nocardia pulmonis TaxID=2951408 RepID=A0A9X2E2Y6_9NOCA|nr:MULTISPECIES: hypothetical protein [Nocardia]MCM6773307.1 hypothetical protein [Nocardia pulmonis]MCM6786194.1 hypothetical protein [Nocardia sp. CDC159]
MRERLWAAGIAGAVVVVVVVVLALGWARPPRTSVISTDRLGPEAGEPVADYLAAARRSLSGTDSGEHWALVSFTAAIAPDRIPDHAGGLRIAQVLHHVSIDRVYTPTVTIPVPAGAEAAVASARAAAALLTATQPPDERSARIAAVSAARLRAGCACTVGLVVRGRLPQLRELSARTDIRAVEALPADAGVYAVVPLLPEYTEVAAPGPDDGAVPQN